MLLIPNSVPSIWQIIKTMTGLALLESIYLAIKEEYNAPMPKCIFNTNWEDDAW